VQLQTLPEFRVKPDTPKTIKENSERIVGTPTYKNRVSGLSGGRSLISHQNLPESKACSSVDRSTPRFATRV
jgi:hypothetical protein